MFLKVAVFSSLMVLCITVPLSNSYLSRIKRYFHHAPEYVFEAPNPPLYNKISTFNPQIVYTKQVVDIPHPPLHSEHTPFVIKYEPSHPPASIIPPIEYNPPFQPPPQPTVIKVLSTLSPSPIPPIVVNPTFQPPSEIPHSVVILPTPPSSIPLPTPHPSLPPTSQHSFTDYDGLSGSFNKNVLVVPANEVFNKTGSKETASEIALCIAEPSHSHLPRLIYICYSTPEIRVIKPQILVQNETSFPQPPSVTTTETVSLPPPTVQPPIVTDIPSIPEAVTDESLTPQQPPSPIPSNTLDTYGPDIDRPTEDIGKAPGSTVEQPVEPPHPGMPFKFKYAVKDYHGNDYSHKANSDGNTVVGFYRVLLPDGREQVVNYTADMTSGYHANVAYEPPPQVQTQQKIWPYKPAKQ